MEDIDDDGQTSGSESSSDTDESANLGNASPETAARRKLRPTSAKFKKMRTPSQISGSNEESETSDLEGAIATLEDVADVFPPPDNSPAPWYSSQWLNIRGLSCKDLPNTDKDDGGQSGCYVVVESCGASGKTHTSHNANLRSWPGRKCPCFQVQAVEGDGVEVKLSVFCADERFIGSSVVMLATDSGKIEHAPLVGAEQQTAGTITVSWAMKAAAEAPQAAGAETDVSEALAKVGTLAQEALAAAVQGPEAKDAASEAEVEAVAAAKELEAKNAALEARALAAQQEAEQRSAEIARLQEAKRAEALQLESLKAASALELEKKKSELEAQFEEKISVLEKMASGEKLAAEMVQKMSEQEEQSKLEAERIKKLKEQVSEQERANRELEAEKEKAKLKLEELEMRVSRDWSKKTSDGAGTSSPPKGQRQRDLRVNAVLLGEGAAGEKTARITELVSKRSKYIRQVMIAVEKMNAARGSKLADLPIAPYLEAVSELHTIYSDIESEDENVPLARLKWDCDDFAQSEQSSEIEILRDGKTCMILAPGTKSQTLECSPSADTTEFTIRINSAMAGRNEVLVGAAKVQHQRVRVADRQFCCAPGTCESTGCGFKATLAKEMDFLASIRGKARASYKLGQRFIELGQPFPVPESELGLRWIEAPVTMLVFWSPLCSPSARVVEHTRAVMQAIQASPLPAVRDTRCILVACQATEEAASVRVAMHCACPARPCCAPSGWSVAGSRL